RVLLTLADMPNITTGVLNELLARPETISACYSDRNRPTVPAAFSHVHFADLLNIDGDQGAKGILNVADEIGKVVISTAMALDIDTAEDLVRLQQQ
ncbi:MAG: NTP transferase domain-containing protein, partial [Planktomarina sp.]